MEQKKTKSYLLYAFGEVFLVVVGILIALQVNNWNEERIKNKSVKSYLIQIQNELLDDLEESLNVTAFLERKDDLIEDVLKEEITMEDYQTNSSLRYLITNSATFILNTDGFDNLKTMIDESSFNNPELLKKLKKLYVEDYASLIQINEWYVNYVHDTNTYLTQNYTWYHTRDRLIDSLSKEELSFLLSDPYYKNRVARYRNLGIGNYGPTIYDMQIAIAELYRSISELTGYRPNVELVNGYFESPSESLYGPYLGSYSNINEPGEVAFRMFVENDSLKIQLFNDKKPIIHIVRGGANRFQTVKRRFQFLVENDSTLREVHRWRNRYVKLPD